MKRTQALSSMIPARLALSAAAGLALAATIPALAQPLPAYIEKPETWTTNLVGQTKYISDAELATWFNTAQTRHSFTLISTFTQCFGGGFLTEYGRQGVVEFGANSASRYFEPASYKPLPLVAGAGGSFYAHEWEVAAAGGDGRLGRPHRTDKQITQVASAANPLRLKEHAQYLANGGADGKPPDFLDAKNKRLAIIFVGKPDPNGRDQADVTQIYSVLTGNYAYAAGDIFILWGAGVAPGGVPWVVNKKADHDELKTAVNDAGGWLDGKLMGADNSVQVFFWAADHGAVQAPITFSVDPLSTGKVGSGVAARRAATGDEQSALYESKKNRDGTWTNAQAWAPPGVSPADIDALSFGNDDVPIPDDVPRLYFSVDRASGGEDGSEVRSEFLADGAVSTDVFIATDSSNRQMFDGDKALGLKEVFLNTDNLNALSTTSITAIINPPTHPTRPNLPSRPVFFSRVGTTTIEVYDPLLNLVYDFLDTTLAFGVAVDIDAVALHVGLARDFADPMIPGRLILMPGDRMLFSVDRASAIATGVKPCEVFKFTQGVGLAPLPVASCDDVGLFDRMGMSDNLNALDTSSPNGPNSPHARAHPADCNADGVVDVLDFFCFVIAFTTGDDYADLTGDGMIDINDFFEFVDLFFQAVRVQG